MSKNLIPVITDCLGVRIGEEFDVNIPYKGQAKYHRYKLTNIGLLRRRNGVDWVSASGFLERLVCGDYEIIKLPFKPVLHEEYWTYDRNWNFVTVAWSNNFFDYLALKNGCVFRTYDEVHDARMSKYEELTGRKWSEENG